MWVEGALYISAAIRFWCIRVCTCNRLKVVKTAEELSDVYAHFLLYYGRDVVAMQHRKTMQRREGEEGEDQVRVGEGETGEREEGRL